MWVRVFLIFSQCIIYNKSTFGNAKALSGVNVRPVAENEISFLACILHNNKNNTHDIIVDRDLICTASLISPNTILSAEHCFNTVHDDGFRIIIGSIDLLRGAVFFPAWFISFEQWSARCDRLIKYDLNDIAIIKLTDWTSDVIEPAALCTLKVHDLYGVETVLAGWGVLSNNSVSSIAHTAKVWILSKSDCEERVSTLLTYGVYIEKVLLCTIAEPHVLLNFGDSGGPLIYNNQIIGINKGVCVDTLQYNNSNQINIHFHIRHYRTFILNHKSIR